MEGLGQRAGPAQHDAVPVERSAVPLDQGARRLDAGPEDAGQGDARPEDGGQGDPVQDDGAPQDPAQEYIALVLDLVAQIPPGRVSSYGDIADAARVLTSRGSARTVGQIMARHGTQVPWWRVMPATGVVPEHLRDRARAHLRHEGTALRSTDPLRLDMAKAGWTPPI